MSSIAYRHWRTTRARALDEIAQAHAAVGGTERGRRYATQQINRAYAVLLASEFQGYCRDLHTECVEHFAAIVSPVALRSVTREEFVWNRQLDRGNANSDTLGADFGRLGIEFWVELVRFDARCTAWKRQLDELNVWRNAIAHQDFDSTRLGGTTMLRLEQVRRWRSACRGLARVFDQMLCLDLLTRTGISPW